MQKLSLNQTLQQKLSPQQIQFIKLLQIPTAELETRIEEELEINPALEEGMEDDILNKEDSYTNDADDEYDDDFNHRDDISLDDYLNHDDYAGYKMYSDGNNPDDDREMPIATMSTLQDALVQQFGYLRLNDRQTIIGLQLLGSFENDGYIRRSLQAIVNDMAFSQGFYASVEEVEQVLKKIQTFDPPGIGARNLQECLLLQLDRKDPYDVNVTFAIKIIEDYFEEFSKKHYEKIQKRLGINDEQMKNVICLITKLNPKPGSVEGEDGLAQYLLPDFWVSNNNGKLEVHLNSRNAPELRISSSVCRYARYVR